MGINHIFCVNIHEVSVHIDTALFSGRRVARNWFAIWLSIVFRTIVKDCNDVLLWIHITAGVVIFILVTWLFQEVR